MSVPQLKPGWRMVKFGDIAQNVTERIDPVQADTDIYVGLEHLDPSTIHLREWGHPSDVTGQKFVFKKGDVIFGRRRAYQRKLAVADRDGICSAHAMVVRAKPKMILSEFLPFFLQSDMFMERAINISVGSLSPTINWTALKIQDFPLPPLEEQKRIAEILWVADEVVERWRSCCEETMTALSVARSQIFQQRGSRVKRVPLKKIGRWISGSTPSRDREDFWDGDFPWVSPKDMKNDIISDSVEKITASALNAGITRIPTNSILIVVRGMILAHTFPVGITSREIVINQDMKGIIPNKDFLPLFIFHWFKSNAERILRLTEESTHGTKRLATDNLHDMKIIKLPLEEQQRAIDVFEALRIKSLEIIQYIESIKKMQQYLVNKTLSV